jgi:hypothetical protein
MPQVVNSTTVRNIVAERGSLRQMCRQALFERMYSTSDVLKCAAYQGNYVANDRNCPKWEEARKVIRCREQGMAVRRMGSFTPW